MFLVAVLARCHGNLAYTLDDPYIHLAMSEHIARGEYGINPGETVAASSSVIWPFLLAPFASTPFHAWVPLAIGSVSAIAFAFGLRRILTLLGFDRSPGTATFASAVTVLICVQLGLVTTVFTGMEHALQALTIVGMLGCLVRASAGSDVRWWGVTAIAAAPLVRYEMIPAAAAAAAALARLGRPRAALTAGLAATGVLGAFALCLSSAGLPMLPASVMTKSQAADAALEGGFARVLAQIDVSLFGPAIRSPAGVLMGCFLAAVTARLVVARRTGPGWPAAWVAVTAVLAHIAVGGWLDDRYVLYAVLFCATASLWLWAEPLCSFLAVASRVRAAACALILVTCVGATTTTVLAWIPMSATNVWEQHGQVHRFVVEHWRRPVAVVDVGWVSYRNEQFVLDLHGLASDRIRRAKHDGRFPEEVAAALRDEKIQLYVGYEFGRPALPRDWIRVGVLHLAGVRSTVAGESVSFVASRSASTEVRALLRSFQPTLPPGVRLDLE